MDNLGIYYDMVVKKDDKIIRIYRKRKCHSFVKQFIQLLLRKMIAPPSSVIIKDITNTNRTLTEENYAINLYLNGPVNSTAYGPVVGTGITEITINDYVMETLIAHGTSAGQLQYSVTVFGAPTTTAPGTSFIVTRVFTNNSGNSITINEIGLYSYLPTYSFLIVHDNLTSPVTLANGETVTLNYTFTTTI